MGKDLKVVVNNDKKQDKVEVQVGVFCTDISRYEEEVLLRKLEEELPIESAINMGCAACSNKECKLHLERVMDKSASGMERVRSIPGVSIKF